MNRRQRRAQEKPGSIPRGRQTAVPPPPLLAEAFRHHQAGRLTEAEALYRQLLDSEPRQADGLHLFGVLAQQMGHPTLAVERIGQAIAVNDGVAAFHSNLGLSQHQLGRLEEAEASFRRALQLQPDFAEVHSNLGNTLRELQRLDEAEAACRRAIALAPGSADAHYNLGLILQRRERREQAMAAYRQAIALAPHFVDPPFHLATLLSDQGRLEEAETMFRQVLALVPAHVDALARLSLVLRQRQRLEEAEAISRQALALQPDSAEILTTLGAILQERDRLPEAEEAYRQAIALRPDYARAHHNLGFLLQLRGRLAEAIASCRQAVALAPDFAEAHSNLGLALLMAGEFTEGWQEQEWRWRCQGFTLNPQPVNAPRWQGEASTGGTILLWAEQGMGDTLQFLRFLPAVAQAGWKIILNVPEPLVPLFRLIQGITVVTEGSPLPSFDVQCPLLSLPLVLGTTLDTLPATTPYLRPDPAKAEQWRRRLAGCIGLKVGLVWRGNPHHGRDRYRSLPAAAVAPLLRSLPQVTFISVQKDARPEELAELVELAGTPSLFDAAPHLEDFSETAGLMANLDLMISVDTSPCHLAGALAVPTWTLLEFGSEWRWLQHREDSPWYPAMRLYRQPQPGDWASVIGRVRADLERKALMARAMEHHQAGRLAEAERLYLQIAAADPHHADSLHLLGVIAHQTGRPDLAVERIGQALALEPDFAEAQCNLGQALEAQGQLAEAAQAYRRAIALKPALAAAHTRLGLACQALGQGEEAVAAFRQAQALQPRAPEALLTLGNGLKLQGRLNEAATAYRQALTLWPDYAEAHLNLGLALHEQGGLDEAVASYRRAVALHPGFAPALRSLGQALEQQGRPEEARILESIVRPPSRLC